VLNEPDATEIRRTRRLRRIAVITGITLVDLILLMVGTYAIAFVILSPVLA
jgi:hypothetical protein